MDMNERVARRFLALKQSAERRGLDFNLSLRSVANLLQSKRCYYTQEQLTFNEEADNQLTVDRIDNNKGYVIGNVVACSKRFNMRKGNLTPDEIELLYRKVVI